MTLATLSASPAEAYQLGPDLRFTNSATGKYNGYTAPAGSSLLPSPWPNGTLDGTGSQLTVYTAATKQAGWPNPYSWSTKAAAFVSVADGTSSTARVQLNSANAYNGDDIYIGYAVYLPQAAATALPEFNNNLGTYLLVSQVFGAPWTRSSPVSVGLRKENGVLYAVGTGPSPASTSDYVWKTPVQADTWIRFVQHVRISQHPVSTTSNGQTIPGGLLETWVNGVKQTIYKLPTTTDPNYDTTGQSMSADHTTAYISTSNLDTTAANGEQFYLDNYRSALNPTFNVPPSITLFQAGARIGTTFNDVAPTATS